MDNLTDVFIKTLIDLPKEVTNPKARRVEKPGHFQVNYKLESNSDLNQIFTIFLRQNILAGMQDDYSCGLIWVSPDGESVVLRRYNGSSHSHPNHLENKRLDYKEHIHYATERYIQAGKKAEGYAEETDRYNSLNGALHCLVVDCNVNGLDTTPDNKNQTNLFE